jgi:GTP cyclohydrolase II
MDLQVRSVYLLTNNPEKVAVFDNSPIVLKGRIPIEIKASQESKKYLETKKTFFKHFLDL